MKNERILPPKILIGLTVRDINSFKSSITLLWQRVNILLRRCLTLVISDISHQFQIFFFFLLPFCFLPNIILEIIQNNEITCRRPEYLSNVFSTSKDMTWVMDGRGQKQISHTCHVYYWHGQCIVGSSFDDQPCKNY